MARKKHSAEQVTATHLDRHSGSLYPWRFLSDSSLRIP